MFIGLPGGIDGLVHLSDLSWSVPGEEAIRNFKKGDEVEAVVLAIDTEKERISLGIKQLDRRSLHQLHRHPREERHRQGHRQVGRCPRAPWLTLDGDMEGYLRASPKFRATVSTT